MSETKYIHDKVDKIWLVYILKCADNTFYTGITNDLDARLNAHETGKGAKYTRSRTPLQVVYSEECTNRSEASKREYAVKQLSRAEKMALIKNDSEKLKSSA